MSDLSAFAELERRIWSSDAQAAAKLVRCYEPASRLTVRTRLTNRVAAALDLTANETEAADA
jgi:hypothetical protein